MRLQWHLLKRLLRYDLPLSAVGALVTWSRSPAAHAWRFLPLATDLAIRFAVVACTAGYGISFLLYRVFYRRELPLFTVCGHHIGSIALVSLGMLILIFAVLLVGSLLLLHWIGL